MLSGCALLILASGLAFLALALALASSAMRHVSQGRSQATGVPHQLGRRNGRS